MTASATSPQPARSDNLRGSQLLDLLYRAAEEDPEEFQQVLDDHGGLSWEPSDLLRLASSLSPSELWKKATSQDPELLQSLKELSPMAAVTSVVQAFPPLDELSTQ